jgi:hypothetical protein
MVPALFEFSLALFQGPGFSFSFLGPAAQIGSKVTEYDANQEKDADNRQVTDFGQA